MILAVFVAYLLFMAGIGLYCSRFNKDIGDFVLGGRRLGVEPVRGRAAGEQEQQELERGSHEAAHSLRTDTQRLP